MIENIERTMNKNGLFYAVLILSCLMLIGIPLLYFPAIWINQDSYQYLSIANYYLMDPSPILYNTTTAGPLIPLILAIFKFILSAIFEWNRYADVLLLKGLALLCYLLIVTSAGIYLKRSVPPLVAFMFLLLFMGLPEWSMDTLSLNGELVSVAWLTLLLAHLSKSNFSPNIFLVCVLSVLVIYTKVQSSILLFLLLASFYYDKKEKWVTLFLLIGCIVFVEMVLYSNGTGLAHNAMDVLSYINHPNAEKGIREVSHGSRYIRNLPWAIQWTQKLVPLFGFIVVYFLLANQKDKRGFLSDWRLWLLAVFFTILTPGRQFSHYVLYAMLFVIIFSEPVLRRITVSGFTQGKLSLASLSIVGVLFAINTAKSITSIEKGELMRGPDVEAAAALTKKGGGRVHIHGWDYQLYTYFNGWNDGTELPYVAMGRADPSWYLNSIHNKKYEYIIDVVGYSGFINNPSFKITNSTIYGVDIGKYYDLVSDNNGLRVFRIKRDGL